MSAYNDSILAYAHAKTVSSKAAAAAAAASKANASSGASVYSDTSSYYPVKDTYMTSSDLKEPKSKTKSPKTKALKNWTKQLVSDIGKPPTNRYDAMVAESYQSAPSATGPANYETNAVGAPYWDNRPNKI